MCEVHICIWYTYTLCRDQTRIINISISLSFLYLGYFYRTLQITGIPAILLFVSGNMLTVLCPILSCRWQGDIGLTLQRQNLKLRGERRKTVLKWGVKAHLRSSQTLYISEFLIFNNLRILSTFLRDSTFCSE